MNLFRPTLKDSIKASTWAASYFDGQGLAAVWDRRPAQTSTPLHIGRGNSIVFRSFVGISSSGEGNRVEANAVAPGDSP